MTNITYFSNILRDDTSSTEDYSTDGSQFQENSSTTDVSSVHRAQRRKKKAVFWTIGKVYSAIANSVNSVPRLQGRSVSAKASSSTFLPPNRIPWNRFVDAELVAVGWPSWLVDVSGESLVGWIPRRADSFEILEKIGQGKHSVVYKGRDTLNGKLVALKKVQFDTSKPVIVRCMAREILILRQLEHPNVMKLEALVTSKMSCSLYLVFEYMEHNLAGLTANTSITFTESQIKCYMQQLLLGLEHCHSRGILHRDIKGSDLLLDKEGVLKISDFGLASFFNPYHKQPMTTRVVSLWYRPPELLLGATHYGVAVDLWSAGCILAELLARRPIMPGKNEVDQLHKIFKLCGSPSEEDWKNSKLPHAAICMPRKPYIRCISAEFKDFPPSSLPLIETLLAIDPDERQTAAAALRSEFFNTKPYACEPSSLPQYPPSKLDAVQHDEDIERLKELHTLKGHLETVMRLKGLDIDIIKKGYTV